MPEKPKPERNAATLMPPPRILPTRRQILAGLVSFVPLATGFSADTALAAADEDSFLAVSKLITGTDALSPEVAARLQGLLVARDPQFDAKLDALVTALGSQTERDAALAGLDDTQAAFALDIAKPWYLGYVGTPSDYVFDDDAEFVTFLEAQSYQKLIDKVPRSSYPDQGPAWWGGPPDGVTAPDMPQGISGWRTYPDGPAEILPPDPAWRAYATAKYPDLAAARRAKPSN